MRRALPLALAALLAFPAVASAQATGPGVPELVKRRDAKLAEAWLEVAPWTVSYEKALERAEKSGKLIFAYFTRSYRP